MIASDHLALKTRLIPSKEDKQLDPTIHSKNVGIIRAEIVGLSSGVVK